MTVKSNVNVAAQQDCLVIGSGIAGLYTALKAANYCNVMVLTKDTLSACATSLAQGGIAAAVAGDDSPERHLKDTISAGAGMCNPQAVKLLVSDGPKRVSELAKMGVPFDKDIDGRLLLAQEGAHSRRRILRAGGDATGRAIQETLIQQVMDNPNVICMERVFATELLIHNGVCYGVLAIQEDEKEPKAFLSKNTILATGGLGQIYKVTTNPSVATGDGIAMACRAGVKVEGMEYIQFHPTVLVHRDISGFLLTEAIRGEGGLLVNHIGERFMPNYHFLGELAPRDVVARAITMEMRRHNINNVYLDVTHLSEGFLKKRFPTIYHMLMRLDINMAEQSIPIAPAAHYFMGGIKTALNGETNFPGLYAAGEVANTGVHGANRLASNSLLEGLVFGGRVADAVRRRLKDKINIPYINLCWPVSVQEACSRDVKNQEIRKRLQKTMQDKVGVIRKGTSLNRAEKEVNRLVSKLPKHSKTREDWETLNMLTVAYGVITAALHRRQSSGSHCRVDEELGNKQVIAN